MDSTHRQCRHRLSEISTVAEFNELLNICKLNDVEKAIITMHYVRGNDLAYIGDMLGYSERTIKRKHRAILHKMTNILY